jgi:5-(carboxyamino)imidazole ribonucleotide synthase
VARVSPKADCEGFEGEAPVILPGATIGVLGGGQLGRMFAQAAARMGYRVHVFDPSPGCPAGEVAAKEVNAEFTDERALAAFAAECAVVTYEFENIPAEPLWKLQPGVLLRPDPIVLRIAQNRLREKTWLRENGIPHARFAESGQGIGIVEAAKTIGLPCVVKTADFGYDGKGQRKIRTVDEAATVAGEFEGRAWVMEAWVDFACEVSVVVARGSDGEVRPFPVVENIHENHILSQSIVPARIGGEVADQARAIAVRVAEGLELVGLMGVEMFALRDGSVLVNEIAPRTHNSGHYTMDACDVSQFEQQVRAVCGLPLGRPELKSPAVMVNLLGDLWDGGTPRWEELLKVEGVSLHLYGKREARSGRKMGHCTVTRPSVEDAVRNALRLSRMVSRKD